jgi:aryl-alcohol dehydrogenase-like predicted oxidoreductase
MQHRRLGRTGLKVSEVSLGTMAFGRWIDEQASSEVLDAAYARAGNEVNDAGQSRCHIFRALANR